MDWLVLFGVLGGGSLILSLGIVIGSRKALGNEIGIVDHKVRNLQHWKEALPAYMDATYVRQKELTLELKPIHDALERIEARLDAVMGKESG